MQKPGLQKGDTIIYNGDGGMFNLYRGRKSLYDLVIRISPREAKGVVSLIAFASGLSILKETTNGREQSFDLF